jgi:monoamine oxidase
MPQRKSPDVLIIGAGFAGAIVARELRMTGLSSTILEARDRIGGRTFTATWLGEVIELGGHYVHWYTNTLSLTLSLSLFPPPPSLKHTHTHTHSHTLTHTHTRTCASRTQPHIWAEMTRYGPWGNFSVYVLTVVRWRGYGVCNVTYSLSTRCVVIPDAL